MEWEGLFVLIFIALMVSVGSKLILKLTFVGDKAAIEQVRSDAKNSRYTLLEAVRWNQKIERKRAYNSIPVIGWHIPDEWEKVK